MKPAPLCCAGQAGRQVEGRSHGQGGRLAIRAADSSAGAERQNRETRVRAECLRERGARLMGR